MASAQPTPTNIDAEKCAASIRSINNNNDTNSNDGGSGKPYDTGIEAAREVLSLQEMDPATTKKMHLVNNVSKRIKMNMKWENFDLSVQALDEIGWTGYHWKLFILSGFG